jgi:hypothetical protein
MSLQELGSLGEFVGGIAVLATLIYLAVQVRQGNQLNRSASIRVFMNEYNALLAQGLNPELAKVLRRGSQDFDGLPRNDQYRVATWLEQRLRTSFAGFVTDPKGENPGTEAVNVTFATVIRLPGYQQWWRRYSPPWRLFAPDYVRMIEELAEHYPSVYEFAPWFEPTDEELREWASS